ncbi:MAG: PD40 domain-containing protein [Planctomycetes bacterium]|nr:PD40 domain-containing protein [Planctomycetota bacterium]
MQGQPAALLPRVFSRRPGLRLPLALALACALAPAARPAEPEPIRMLRDFALSPDGATLVFSWAGDIWKVESAGGDAVQLTRDPANDHAPCFSPDGREIAFNSNRQGGDQVFVMPATGGPPEQITFHSEGCELFEYDPSGDFLLTLARRDHFWYDAQRFFKVNRRTRSAEELLFDDYGEEGTLSPCGSKLLFTREGAPWFRKGYRGSQAAQIWLYDLDKKEFRQLLHDDLGFRSPLWRPDGKGFYCVGQQSGSFNLWEHDLETGARTQLTAFDDDAVLWPAISRDGSTIVFRHLFDLYRLRPGGKETPRRLEILNAGEPLREEWLRRSAAAAEEAAFTDDGLEVALIAGGDLWVMDTELKEPRQVTDTVEMESDPVFSADGAALFFVSRRDGQSDIWRAERAAPELYWWQNEGFTLKRLTTDAEVERGLSLSPDGKRLAFVRGAGDLMTMDENGKDVLRVVASWNALEYDWSPDGKWIVFSRQDHDYNSDIWIAQADGAGEPFNLSVHPDNDLGPTWSPDGRVIAFVGRRADQEIDVYYAWLREEDAEKDARDLKLEKALEKMKKERKKKEEGKKDDGKEEEKEATKEAGAGAEKEKKEEKEGEKKEEEKKDEEKPPEVKIDFAGIHDRIRQVSVPESAESGLFWLEEKKLAFTSEPKGDRGLYTVTFPDELTPKKLSGTVLEAPRRLKKAKSAGGLSSRQPSVMTAAGQVESYAFSARQEQPHAERYRAAFVEAWRIMRDTYYDERLGNRNWDAIRRKYADMAAAAIDPGDLQQVCSLMLGELNGSHLGFSASWSGYRGADSWNAATAHLGLRFDPTHKGPGWKVRDVIKQGPADEEKARIAPGEIVLSVDGVTVDPSLDASQVLNGDLARDILLRVQNDKGEERDVTLRPISYAAARSHLYDMWLDSNRAAVDQASGGTLGYLHIQGMSWPSFLKFEEELYRIAYGKEGLIVDVRANGGGHTADHLLTALTQPAHAITVGRGGGPGYPQDRQVYATWHKPVAVLCDQNSFSNAEIFAHAIKSLGRGQLIGAPTAGGVISTGASQVMDMGVIRTPNRGWFIQATGEDMERNGAVPHHLLWPEPGEIPAGTDRQLRKAVEVLLEDVARDKERGAPPLRKASER